MLPALAHIDTWIFDLDNTLYRRSANLFALIDARMTAFVGDLLGLDPVAARRVQKDYFLDHGTTLAGLMANHEIDPAAFLAYVHDIEMDVLEANAPSRRTSRTCRAQAGLYQRRQALRAEGARSSSASARASRRCTTSSRWPWRPSWRRRPMPGCAPRSPSTRTARSSSRTWRAT
ncbi:hypothetical protein AB5I41_15690 [Sphingomonas sp. MMS24-JH45]